MAQGTQDNSILGIVGQIGAEASPGAGGNANRRLPNSKYTLSSQGDFNEYKGEGSKFVNSVVPGDEWSSGDYSCPMSFSEVIWPLESIIKKVTPTGGAGSSQTRVYSPNPNGPDTIQTFVAQRGNGHYNRQFTHVFWNDLTMTFARKEAMLSGTVMGQQVTFPTAMTTSPTLIENALVTPKLIDLFYADTWANLSVSPTQILRGFNLEFKIGSRYNPFYPMNSSLPSFAGITESADLDASLSLKLGADVNYVGAWQATTAYTLGVVRTRLTGTGLLVFKVTTAGTTGAAEPTWPTTIGGTVTDGTVVWTAILPDYGDPVNMDVMRRGATVFLRAKVLGPQISGAVYYMLQADFCAVVNSVPGEDDENGLATNTWGMRITPEPGGTLKPFEITVVNKVAAV